MPFIDNPIFCTVCNGTGKIKPICAFQVHQEKMMIDCVNCRGMGTIPNKIYINPEPSTISTNTNKNNIENSETGENLEFSSEIKLNNNYATQEPKEIFSKSKVKKSYSKKPDV